MKKFAVGHGVYPFDGNYLKVMEVEKLSNGKMGIKVVTVQEFPVDILAQFDTQLEAYEWLDDYLADKKRSTELAHGRNLDTTKKPSEK